MDPASGIVGIVGVGIQVCATLYKIGEGATSAGNEIPELIGHIEFTNSILNTLQKELQKPEVKAIIDSNAEDSFRNAMTKCKIVYTNLEQFFDKQIRKFADGSLEVRSSAKLLWFLREENFELQRQKLVSLRLDILLLMNVFQVSVSYRSRNAANTYDSSHQHATENGKQKLLDLIKRQKESEQRIALLETKEDPQALAKRENSQLKSAPVSPIERRTPSRSRNMLSSSAKNKDLRTSWTRRTRFRVPIRSSKVKTKKLSSSDSITKPLSQKSLRTSLSRSAKRLVQYLRDRSVQSETSEARSVEDLRPELIVLAETETRTSRPNSSIHGLVTPRTGSVVEEPEAIRDTVYQYGAISLIRNSSDTSIVEPKTASQIGDVPEVRSGGEITTEALQEITEQIQKLEMIVEETNRAAQATESALEAENEKRRATDVDLQREASRSKTLEAKMKALESSVGKKNPRPRVRFQDCVGRKFDFPWQLVSTWAGMERLVKLVSEQPYAYFPGPIPSQVTSGQYNILGPEGQIIIPTLWELLVEPEWHLSMQLWPLPDEPEMSPKRRMKRKSNQKPHATAHIPTYPRIHRKYLDLETLEFYHVPWEWDRSSNDYIVLLRELDKYETEVLFEHTRRRRKGQSTPAQKESVDRPDQSHRVVNDEEAVAALVLKYTNLDEFEGYQRGPDNSALVVCKADTNLKREERRTT